MPELNANIPQFEAWLQAWALWGEDCAEPRALHQCYVFALAAIPGRCLCFHVLMPNGAQIGRVPIHAIQSNPDLGPDRELGLDDLELWDVPSERCSVIEYDALSNMRIVAYLKNGDLRRGRYLFTVDYWGTPAAENAGDLGWKCHHVVELDGAGRLAALPNNRLCFLEGAFGVQPFAATEVPSYKTMRSTYHCEDGLRWRTSDDDRMFYGVGSGSHAPDSGEERSVLGDGGGAREDRE